MQDQGSGSSPQEYDRGVGAIEHSILTTLLCESDEQEVWSRDELARFVADDQLDFPTALKGLHRAGLINVCGDVVFISRAARRTEQIVSEP